MGREVVELAKTNERVHVSPKIAAGEDYEVKQCTEDHSLSQNHNSSNVITNSSMVIDSDMKVVLTLLFLLVSE